jgi:PD-(D/E)XK nuclease superfamily
MYDTLLKRFTELKSSFKEERETFFDIAGYPHYENVISNVLAFFLDPAKGHGLGTFCIEALMQVIEPETYGIDGYWEVEREVRTEKGNYIDIILQSETIVIVIENKIYASVYNDLQDYIEFIQKKNKGKKVFGIVLCLQPPNPEGLHNEYKIVTYDKFFGRVRQQIGYAIEEADPRYFQLLTDLMTNVRKLKEGTRMDRDFFKFVSDNNKDIVDLLGKIKDYRDQLRSKVKQIKELVPKEIEGNSITQFEWREQNQLFDIAVSEFVLNNGVRLVIDSKLDYSGWTFEIFQRGNIKDFDVEDYCQKRSISGIRIGERYKWVEEFPFDEEIPNVANKIEILIRLLTK